MSSIKHSLAMAAMPLAQAIVRRAPPSRLRESVWRWGMWRSKSFVTRVNGIAIAGNTLDLIQGYLYWFGVWEPNLTQFIRRRMDETPDRTFVDVGANIGYFSTFVAKRYPNAFVVSIEAFPPTVEKLRSNIDRNALKNARIIAAAASDASGDIKLFYAGNLNEGATTSVQGKFTSTPVTVPSKPLAELLSDEEINSTRIIKIDVEGAESNVIAGLASKLSQFPNDVEIVVEVSVGSTGNSKSIFDTFLARGFNAYELENKYDALSYLYPQTIKRPFRITTLPAKQTDIVFSRINAAVL